MSGRAGHPHRRWRLSNKKAHLDTVRNDINVTPLVDVMLVLLIIFMLMTMVMGRGKDVHRPSAHNFSQEKDKMQPIITVDNNLTDGPTLYVEKNKIGPVFLNVNAGVVNESALKEMDNQITAAWNAPKNPESVGRVFISADAAVEYRYVLPVIAYLNRNMAMQSIDLAISRDSKEQ